MLIVNFSGENPDPFKEKFKDVATAYQGKGISFLLGDLEATKNVLQVYFFLSHFAIGHYRITTIFARSIVVIWRQYYGLKDDQTPLIYIQQNDDQKYIKTNLEADHIATWFKEYMVMLMFLFIPHVWKDFLTWILALSC